MEVRSSGLLSMMIDFSMYAHIPNSAVLLEEAVGRLTDGVSRRYALLQLW